MIFSVHMYVHNFTTNNIVNNILKASNLQPVHHNPRYPSYCLIVFLTYLFNMFIRVFWVLLKNVEKRSYMVFFTDLFSWMKNFELHCIIFLNNKMIFWKGRKAKWHKWQHIHQAFVLFICVESMYSLSIYNSFFHAYMPHFIS